MSGHICADHISQPRPHRGCAWDSPLNGFIANSPCDMGRQTHADSVGDRKRITKCLANPKDSHAFAHISLFGRILRSKNSGKEVGDCCELHNQSCCVYNDFCGDTARISKHVLSVTTHNKKLVNPTMCSNCVRNTMFWQLRAFECESVYLLRRFVIYIGEELALH